MTKELSPNQGLFPYLLRLGDNCLILGHRLSEWCGHAPVLEEDIATANIALDLIGQAQLWLGLAAEVENKGRTADDLAYLRDSAEFMNILLVEQPNGDYGQTLMRQFLFDGFHLALLQALSQSKHEGIETIASKAVKEVKYHYERSRDLVIRLGDGSQTSQRKMQDALNQLWPYCGEMFLADEVDRAMGDSFYGIDPTTLKAEWHKQISQILQKATLALPSRQFYHQGGKQGRHSEYLGHLLAEMQFLPRAYPGGVW